MKTIGIIGCGNMGSAIAAAMAGDPRWSIALTDTRSEHAAQIARSCHATAMSLQALLQASSLVILAVKPQVIGSLYADLKAFSTKVGWISLIAGVSLETLSQQLGSDRIVRIQPNIAAQVGKAVTAVTPHPLADADLIEETYSIVRTFGTAFAIPEEHMAAFTGVSGSAIAACLTFLHGVAMGGFALGLPYTTALALIRDTAESATALLRESGRNPIELATTVCSPGGTTIEMMQVLGQAGFEGTLMEAVRAVGDKVHYLDEKAALNASAGQ